MICSLSWSLTYILSRGRVANWSISEMSQSVAWYSGNTRAARVALDMAPTMSSSSRMWTWIRSIT